MIDERWLEDLHRKSRGNAALLLRLAQAWSRCRPLGGASGPALGDRPRVRGLERRASASPGHLSDLEAEARPDLAREIVREQNGSPRPTSRGLTRADAPALVPSKPPIRDEDGLVEVGWEGDLEDELPVAEKPAGAGASLLADDSAMNEELIEDHYAALQAISERTRNEAWLAAGEAGATAGEDSGDLAEGEETPADQPAGRPSEAAGTPGGIRAEGQHEFAPYSQLFTRFRQSK